jgi:hypothetical protein
VDAARKWKNYKQSQKEKYKNHKNKNKERKEERIEEVPYPEARKPRSSWIKAL